MSTPKIEKLQLRLIIIMTLQFLQNKLTPLSIFRDLALRKGDSKKFMFYFYVLYRVYTNIPKLFGLVVYYFSDFLGDSVACARFGKKISKVLTFTIS